VRAFVAIELDARLREARARAGAPAAHARPDRMVRPRASTSPCGSSAKRRRRDRDGCGRGSPGRRRRLPAVRGARRRARDVPRAWQPPRALARARRAPPVVDLQAACEAGGARAGLEKEDRPFRAHLNPWALEGARAAARAPPGPISARRASRRSSLRSDLRRTAPLHRARPLPLGRPAVDSRLDARPAAGRRRRLPDRLDPVQLPRRPRVRCRDVRRVGSGNVGATNVLRNAEGRGGPRAPLDIGKGAAATELAGRLAPGEAALARRAAVAAVIGHMYPVWLRFRGGQGGRHGLGAFAPLAPKARSWPSPSSASWPRPPATSRSARSAQGSCSPRSSSRPGAPTGRPRRRAHRGWSSFRHRSKPAAILAGPSAAWGRPKE